MISSPWFVALQHHPSLLTFFLNHHCMLLLMLLSQLPPSLLISQPERNRHATDASTSMIAGPVAVALQDCWACGRRPIHSSALHTPPPIVLIKHAIAKLLGPTELDCTRSNSCIPHSTLGSRHQQLHTSSKRVPTYCHVQSHVSFA